MFVGSDNNIESIRAAHANTVDELNQKLLTMKEAYEKVDAEKQDLINELEKRSVHIDQESIRQATRIVLFFLLYFMCNDYFSFLERVSADIFKQPFKEVRFYFSYFI